MTIQLLDRVPGPAVQLHPEIALAVGRVHEGCGPARRTFALWLAARTVGPVLWISASWEADQPNPDGVRPLVDPGRLLFVHPRRAVDLLWCTEEALRSGAVPLVIVDLPAAPALTPVRRLLLAAGSAAGAGGTAPLGLLLTPGDGGARGVESRWHLAPAHEPGIRAWRLQRRRARTLPPRAWTVEPETGGGLRLIAQTG
jgi:protein ImuA